MDKIKRFIECLIPVTACNLKCSYCYVIQRKRNEGRLPKLEYDVPTIKKGLCKERMGGTCYFSICGAGETLIPHETIEIVKALLENGHYVNITTNGTLTNRFEEIVSTFSEEELSRLHFAFSFHYLELLRTNKLDTFFQNIDLVKKAGCSILVQFNLCDEYIPHLKEMYDVCVNRVGAPPQVAATRKEEGLHHVELMTKLTKDEYTHQVDAFESPLFDFTMKNFNVKRTEFCNAGEWSFVLNLATGIMHRCYWCSKGYDIFKDLNKPIPFCSVGKACRSEFCMNSSHFMSLGVIPSISTPSYAELRNRKTNDGQEWYTEKMKAFLNQKLCDNNKSSGPLRMFVFNTQENIHRYASRIKQKMIK